MLVELVRSSGDEDTIVSRAMNLEPHVSHSKDTKRFVRMLMKQRHGTPFEVITLEFYVEIPLFTLAQWHRHRIGWSYNVASQRYREASGKTWLPALGRPLKKVENFNPMKPEFADSAELTDYARYKIKSAFDRCWQDYCDMRAAGVADEVARVVLPQSTYTSMYAQCNLRSFMHWASLRCSGGFFSSHPQWEIEELALQMRREVATIAPHTMEAFTEIGLISP